MRRLFATLVALTIGLSALAQPPEGGRGGRGDKGGDRGGFGGRGMMMMGGGNMDQMFDRFSKGKDVIRRDDLDPMMQMGFDMMARRLNITGNEITREQAKQFGEQMQSRMREGGGGMGGGMNPQMADRFTEESFRRRDRNGDGLLDASEMSDGLKSERDKWDTNKDGFIDLNEYKAYATARFGDQRSGDKPATDGATPTDPNVVPQTPIESDTDYRRPTVFRYGHLPKELPEWFAQLDVDIDGQVSLYEWVKGNKAVEQFREMDANDDDFVTAEEVLRFQNGGKILNYNLTSAYQAENREPAYRTNRDNGNANGRGGRGGPGGGNWMGGGRGPGGNSGDNTGRSNWMNGGGGGPGNWGNRGPGGGGDRTSRGGSEGRGPGGGMEKGKAGMEKGMGKGGRGRGNNGGDTGGSRP